MDPSLRRSSRLSRAALAAVLVVAAVVLPGTRLRGQQQPNISAPQSQGLSTLHIPAQGLSTLHITVTSETDGTPISGATLHLGIRAHPLADAHTDAQGSLTVESLPPGSCTVKATAPRKAKVTKVINLDAATDNTVSFTLPAGGSVSGKVTDDKGNPVAGMGVDVYIVMGRQTDYVETNSEGIFKSDHLPLMESLRVVVNGDDTHMRNLGHVLLWPSQPHGTLNLVLKSKPPGGSVAGTVVDGDGKPIAQAQITYQGISSTTQPIVKTDATGDFRLDEMQYPRLPIDIFVRADGWAPMTVTIAQTGTKEAPAQVAVRMSERGHHITGRVVDAAGEPIKSVRVTAHVINRGYFYEFTSMVTTGADGRFSFDSLPANGTFDFRARGYSNIEYNQLPLDGAGDVIVAMQILGGIAGKVVDADTGQPIPAFNVKEIPTSTVDPGQNFSGGTGEFRVEGLDSGTEVTLVVAAEGYPVQQFDHIATSSSGQGGPTIIRLSKYPPNQIGIAGRIVDADGNPIAGVEVRALAHMPGYSRDAESNSFNWQMLKSGQLSYQRYIRTIEQTRTDSNGVFSFVNLTGPDVDLAYWGDRVPEARLLDIDRQPSDQREHLKIRVPAPATISGRINRQAYPTETEVALRSSTAPQLELMQINLKSGEDRYSFAPVGPGSYDIVVFVESVSRDPGLLSFHAVATDPVEVKEGESRQLDLGFAKGDVAATQPNP
jgi:protocatechuate 3,4-dioxygenase beta subunit